MDEAVSAAPAGATLAVALAEPTLCALGLAARQPTLGSDVAAGALRLLEPAPVVSELAEGITESLDELIVGVVEAVEECVLTPPPDCANVRARVEVEAISWVDDFIADEARDDDVASRQYAMFQLAWLVADAVAEALTVRMYSGDGSSAPRRLRVEPPDLGRIVDELRRRGVDAVRWGVQVATPLRWLHR